MIGKELGVKLVLVVGNVDGRSVDTTKKEGADQ